MRPRRPIPCRETIHICTSRLSRSHHLEIWRHLTGRAVQISEFVGILKYSYDVRNIATNLHKSTRFLRYSRSVSTRSIVVFENDKRFPFYDVH